MSNLPDNGGNGGGLTPGGRFARMEESLQEILRKLDTKADAMEIARLDARLTEVEHGNNPLATVMLEQFRDTAKRLTAIESQGSREAQEALSEAHTLREKVTRLSTTAESQAAVAKAQTDARIDRNNTKILLIMSVAAINAAFNVLQVTHLIH